MVTAILLAAGAAGMIGFKFGTLTTAQSFRGTPPSIAAQNVLSRYFPAGSGEPIDVISTASSAEQVKDRAGRHARHRLRHPAGDQGRPVLPAGDP